MEQMVRNVRKSKLRAFLTDGVRNGKMYFRPGKKANLAVPREYLLVRGCFVTRNRNSLKLA